MYTYVSVHICLDRRVSLCMCPGHAPVALSAVVLGECFCVHTRWLLSREFAPPVDTCASMHCQVQLVAQSSTLLWESIADVKHSSVFYWLTMHASEKQRKTFLNVLVDIHNKQKKIHALNPWSWSHCSWSRYVRSYQKLLSNRKMDKSYPIGVGSQ